MSNRISRNLSSETLSNLIAHLEGSSSKAIDKELRDQFDVMLGSSTTISAGTYPIHGLSSSRVLFKSGDIFYWVDRSNRGTSFTFSSDSSGSTVSEGSESGHDTTSFSDFDFYGTDDNASNVQYITFSSSTSVNSWLTESNVGKFSRGYSTINTVTKESSSRGGSAGPEYKLNLDLGTHFYLDYEFPSSFTDYNKLYITLENNLNLIDESSNSALSIFLYLSTQETGNYELSSPINIPNVKLDTSYSGNTPQSSTLDVTSFNNFSFRDGMHSLHLDSSSSTYLIPLKLNVVKLPFGGTSSFKIYTTLVS